METNNESHSNHRVDWGSDRIVDAIFIETLKKIPFFV